MAINPYDVLGVEKSASFDEISKAYFKLAKEFHPDINKAPEANRHMQEINSAYEILRNPEKRKQYDFISGEGYSYTHVEQPEANYSGYEELFKCQRCGAIDHTLRIVQFPYVISLLLVTLRRGWAGIFCSECRKEEMAKAKIISLFLGWWGFPWGFIYTLDALFSTEGKIPQQPNTEFLKSLGAFLFSIGDAFGAKKAFEQSNAFQEDSNILKVLETLKGMNLIERKKEKQPKPTLAFFRISLGLTIIIPMIYLVIHSSNSSEYIAPTPITAINIAGESLNQNQIILNPYFTSNNHSWDKYTNYSEGFSIDYPSNFEREISSDQVSFYTDNATIDTDYILFEIYFEDIDFIITSSDLTYAFINEIENELFVKQGYKVINPLKKEYVSGYLTLTGKHNIDIEGITAIQYSSIVFKNNRVYTLVAIGPEEIDDLMGENFQIYKESLNLN